MDIFSPNSFTIVDMDTRTAACRVLSSPELLCSIFLHLDQRTLLVSAQRVSKNWHHQISSVSVLRRHLFLDFPIESNRCDRDSRSQPTPNPLLSEVFAPWFNGGTADDESAFSDDDDAEDDAQEASDKINSPIARSQCPPTELYRQLKSSGVYKLRKKKSANPFLRPGSSWMQMHITDPPATNFELHRKTSHRGGHRLAVSELYYPAGLRMGQFYAITLAFTRRSRRSCNMEITWPSSNMRLYRPNESQTSQAGILRTFKYSWTRWMRDEDKHQERPTPLYADLVLKTSEFFGCVFHSTEREMELHSICGQELMSQLFGEEVEAATKSRKPC